MKTAAALNQWRHWLTSDPRPSILLKKRKQDMNKKCPFVKYIGNNVPT
jgi:hypothetical protein